MQEERDRIRKQREEDRKRREEGERQQKANEDKRRKDEQVKLIQQKMFYHNSKSLCKKVVLPLVHTFYASFIVLLYCGTGEYTCYFPTE